MRVNYMYEKGTSILIFGLNARAYKMYYLWRKRYNIVGFMDNSENSKKIILGGVEQQVYKLSELNSLIRQGIVVVIVDDCYIGLQKWFKKKQYRFYEQYIIEDFFEVDKINIELLMQLELDKDEISNYLLKAKGEKKGFFIFGNCQTIVIKKYLLANERFFENYILFWVPEIYRTKNPSIFDRKEFWPYVDILAIIPISDDNRLSPLMSTNAFLRRISSHTKVIIFPNLWFVGYFIQMERENEVNVLTDFYPNGFAKYGDKFLKEMIYKKVEVNEVLQITKNEIFTNEEIGEHMKKSLSDLHKIDDISDFGIADYIEENLDKDVLFFSPNHPRNYVLKELTSRLLRYLQLYKDNEEICYKNEKLIDKADDLKITTCAVYPDVLKFLHLEHVQDELTYNPGGVFREPITFDEYVKNFMYFSDKLPVE